MTIYAYLRVSTDAQDTDNQRRGVAEYCAARDWLPGYVEDTASGRTPWQDRALGHLLARMSPGDVLVVSEVSRLARSTLQVLEICKLAADRGLMLHIVKTGQVIDDSMASKVLTTMLALAAEIERDMIRSRTREALARLKSEGVQLGRPPGPAQRLKLDDKADQIDNLRRCNVPLRAIARVLDCSPQTLYDWIKARRPAPADPQQAPSAPPARRRKSCPAGAAGAEDGPAGDARPQAGRRSHTARRRS